MQSNRHCHMIDVCKLLLTIEVALMHFETAFFNKPKRIFEGGYLAVDFFFVLSGFLLYRSYESGKYRNALAFTASRLKVFTPYAAIIFVSDFILRCCQQMEQLKTSVNGTFDFIAQRILYSFNELLFLQMFLPSQRINFPMWYMSVLIIVGLGYYMYLETRACVRSGGC